MSRVRIAYCTDKGTPLPSWILQSPPCRRWIEVHDTDPAQTQRNTEEAIGIACDWIDDITGMKECHDLMHEIPRAAYRAWITFSRAVPGCPDGWIKDCIQRLLRLADDEPDVWARIDIHVVPGPRPKFELVMHRRIAQSAL